MYRHGVRAPLPRLEGECRGGGHLPLVCCTPRALHKASRLRVLDIHDEWIQQQKGRPSSRLGLPSPHRGAPKLLRGLLILRAPQRAWHTTDSQMTPAGPNNPRVPCFSTQGLGGSQSFPTSALLAWTCVFFFFLFLGGGVGGGWGKLSGHHRMFSSLPGFAPLDASRTGGRSCNNQNRSGGHTW